MEAHIRFLPKAAITLLKEKSYWIFVDLLTMGVYSIDNQLNKKSTNKEQWGNKKIVVDIKTRRNQFVDRLLPLC